MLEALMGLTCAPLQTSDKKKALQRDGRAAGLSAIGDDVA